MNTRNTTIALAFLPALLGALAIGAVGAWARDDASDAVVFAVLTAATLPPLWGLGVLALDRTPNPAHDEDSVERHWNQRATSAAFYDLVLVMGLCTMLTSVLDIPPFSATIFLFFAMADYLIRLMVLSRREG